jgi:hypothetical protein
MIQQSALHIESEWPTNFDEKRHNMLASANTATQISQNLP